MQHALRYLAHHAGVPTFLVAAVLVVVGYRLLRLLGRFAIEVVAVSLFLLAASEMGWVRW